MAIRANVSSLVGLSSRDLELTDDKTALYGDAFDAATPAPSS
jgi:hypothetical protein